MFYFIFPLYLFLADKLCLLRARFNFSSQYVMFVFLLCDAMRVSCHLYFRYKTKSRSLSKRKGKKEWQQGGGRGKGKREEEGERMKGLTGWRILPSEPTFSRVQSCLIQSTPFTLAFGLSPFLYVCMYLPFECVRANRFGFNK